MPNTALKFPRDNTTKRRACHEFARRLLASEIGPQIACVLLFGSVARHEDEPDSDVDILVFGDKINPGQVETVADLAWETTLATDEFIAPLAYNLNDLLEPGNYLLFETTRQAEVLYRMEETQIRRLEAGNLYRKAEIHLDEARKALDQGAFHLALVGAYTAAELAAKALLYLKPGIEAPSRHGSIVRLFGREYVETGEVPAAWGRSLNRKLEARSRALYDTTTIIEDSTEPESMISLAQEMLAYLRDKLSSE